MFEQPVAVTDNVTNMRVRDSDVPYGTLILALWKAARKINLDTVVAVF